jgi:hypothetical protein
MTRTLFSLLISAVLFVAVSGCSHPPEVPGFPERATRAYEAFLEQPNPNTYHRFISENRKVGIGRETPNDEIGVLIQVRALEVQSIQAKATGNLNLAVGVVDRVGEIEEGEVIEVYDEVLPGAKARLHAARDRVAAMVE